MTVTFGPDHIVSVYRWAMEIADYGRAKAS